MPTRRRLESRGRHRFGAGAGSLWPVWLAGTLLMFGLCAAWALVTPIGATNDEGAQVVKAASTVRGQILGQPLDPVARHALGHRQLAPFRTCVAWDTSYFALRPGVARARCAAAFTVVTVPASFSAIPGAKYCNAFEAAPDTCPVHLDGSNQRAQAITYVGRYPPLYYAVVGWPSLLTQTNLAVYGMRLVSGLVVSGLLGLAFAMAVAWSARRMLFLAVAAACTPMVVVFGSTVNPSGVEMAAALCVWTGVLILVLEHPEQPPPRLVAASAASAALFALTRPLSVFWLATIALFVVLLAPRAVVRLAADRAVRIGAGVVALAAVLCMLYVVWAQSWHVLPVGRPVPAGTSWWKSLQLAAGNLSYWFHQFTGAFGWSLTRPPGLTIALVTLAICGLLIGAMVTGGRRHLVVFGLLSATAVLLPVLLVTSQAGRDGMVWQARDGFPLTCGVILLAGSISRFRPGHRAVGGDPGIDRAGRRFAVLVACCVAGAQLADFYWAARRYGVGLWGPINALSHVTHGFSPPVPMVVLVGAALALCAAYGWWIVTLSVRTAPDRPDAPSGASGSWRAVPGPSLQDVDGARHDQDGHHQRDGFLGHHHQLGPGLDG